MIISRHFNFSSALDNLNFVNEMSPGARKPVFGLCNQLRLKPAIPAAIIRITLPVCFIPYTPLLYSKTGVRRGIYYFLIFALKHILWVLVRTASITHNIFLSKNSKKKKSTENCHFYSREKSLHILRYEKLYSGWIITDIETRGISAVTYDDHCSCCLLWLFRLKVE